MNDLFTNGATSRLEICTDHRRFNPDCPRRERERAIVRRDHKRDIRRHLPEPARPLVTLADVLDQCGDDLTHAVRQPWNVAPQLHDAAEIIRRALADLADDTNR